MTAETQLTIDRDHPALAGHFPGNPVVPGAVLLAIAVAAAEEFIGAPVEGVALAKFPTALRPGVDCTLRVAADGSGNVRVTCEDAAAVYLTAVLEPGL